MRFLNLTIADDVPDSKTVWYFRERLIDLDLIETLFNLFLEELERLNLVVNEGKIVDADDLKLWYAFISEPQIPSVNASIVGYNEDGEVVYLFCQPN